MDLLVDPHVFAPLAVLVKIDHTAQKPAHFRELRLGHPLAGELAREALDGPEHPIKMLDIGGGELGDDHAAVGQLVDEALGRQRPQGFAQRGARHAQFFAELHLAEPRAGRQLAGDLGLGRGDGLSLCPMPLAARGAGRFRH